MLVRVFSTLENYEEFNIKSNSVKEILNNIKYIKGKDYTINIIDNEYNYVLASPDLSNILPLSPDVLFSDLPEDKMLLIFPKLEGDIPVPIVLIELGMTLGLTAAQAGTMFAMIGNLAISVALSSISTLLAPTPTS